MKKINKAVELVLYSSIIAIAIYLFLSFANWDVKWIFKLGTWEIPHRIMLLVGYIFLMITVLIYKPK